MSASLSFLHDLCLSFIDAISSDPDIEITETVRTPEASEVLDILRRVSYAVGVENIDVDWLMNLWVELTDAFDAEISVWEGAVASFLTTHNSKLNVAGKVFFHLVENKSDDYPFAFLATYSTESETHQKANHVPLKNALIEFKGKHDMLLKLLSTVSRAADSSDFISELVESGELFSPLKFSTEEAYVFLKEIPLYEECGIMCRMPDWWKKKSSAIKASVSIGGREPSQLGLNAIIQCKPGLLLDGEELSREEVEALLSKMEGLSFLKGKWVEVDHEKLKSVLDAYEKAEQMDDITLADAMRMELGILDSVSLDAGDTVEVTSGQWLKSLRNRLVDPVSLEGLEPGTDFKAQLRHYQQTGFGWLATMKDMGFGALLADDIGLGKTVQILALLEFLRQNGGFKGLLIIPASLIGNWQKEIVRFTPE